MRLTIAIICKNEEKNIKRCLDSVFKHFKPVYPTEILLVDSFSTDKTLKIARKYPVKIIRLQKDWPHCPAAGRYISFCHAKGVYTLCLDGDMELAPGFIEKAVQFLDDHLEAGAVTGILENVCYREKYKPLIVNSPDGQKYSLRGLPADHFPTAHEGILDSVPGAGMFRTSVVRNVGNFHPFLRAEEEYELCQRLRAGGYELWYIPCLIARHYGYEQNEFKELMRRINNGFMAGVGEMFKWSCKTGFFKPNFKRFFRQIMVGCYMALLPAVLVCSLLNPAIGLVWFAGVLTQAVAFCIKKKNVAKGLTALLTQIVVGLSILCMMPAKVMPPESYPLDVIMVNFWEKEPSE